MPDSSATPSKGKIGELHIENGIVIALTAPKDRLDVLLGALKANHPYETPVIDIYPLIRHSFDALMD